MKIKSLLLPVIALCMAAAHTHAATIVYNFSGTSTQVSSQVATQAATSNSFNPLLGITTSVWNVTGASGGNRTTTVAINQSGNSNAAGIGSAARALKATSNATHTFSVTIPAGITADFTSLSFRHGAFGADASASNPTSFTFSATNGGTATPTSGSAPLNPSNTSFQFTDYTLALSGLTGETGTTITFSIVDTSGGNNNSLDNQFTYIDNVILTGTAVPEPSAALLGGLGMLCLLRRRR